MTRTSERGKMPEAVTGHPESENFKDGATIISTIEE
jgi:hypothetical protein